MQSFLRDNILILSFGFLGLIFLAIGTFSLVSQNSQPEIIFEEGAKTGVGKIKVDIGGAVVRPQVYEISEDARIQDVLILAGGLSSSADREWVAKNLNLASKLTDGAKIYIPQEREQSGSMNYELGIKNNGNSGGKININTASEAELDKLPGVGPVTARKIISARPYQFSEDLVNKKVISDSVFSKFKEQITLW